jgi:hypothetical protein
MRILIVVRLVYIVVISVLAIKKWWRYYHRDPHWTNVPPDAGSNFWRKLRRGALVEMRTAIRISTSVL